MNPEMFNAAVLSFTLILVGLGVGFLLINVQKKIEGADTKMRIQGNKDKA